MYKVHSVTGEWSQTHVTSSLFSVYIWDYLSIYMIDDVEPNTRTITQQNNIW